MTIIVDTKLLYYNEGHSHKPPLNLFGTLVNIIKQIEYQSGYTVSDIIFVYDIGKSSYRINLWSKYKAKRTYTHLPEGFKEIYEEVVKQIADSLGIYSFPILNLEADDLAGILSNKITDNIVLVSNDWDWKQLVISYPDKVQLFYIKSWSLLQYSEVIEITGCSTVEQFLIKKAILGDTGDNIIGIPSIGPVKFKKWADESFKLPDEDLKDSFILLCKSTKKPPVHIDYSEHVGISTCEELYTFNMSLGRIMTGIKHISLEQKVSLNACWAIYAIKDNKLDMDKAIQLSEEYSKGHFGPFGSQWSLAEADLSIYKRIYNDKSKKSLSK